MHVRIWRFTYSITTQNISWQSTTILSMMCLETATFYTLWTVPVGFILCQVFIISCTVPAKPNNTTTVLTVTSQTNVWIVSLVVFFWNWLMTLSTLLFHCTWRFVFPLWLPGGFFHLLGLGKLLVVFLWHRDHLLGNSFLGNSRGLGIWIFSFEWLCLWFLMKFFLSGFQILHVVWTPFHKLAKGYHSKNFHQMGRWSLSY